MATWVCRKCGNKTKSRCRPGKCAECGASKEAVRKEEAPKGET